MIDAQEAAAGSIYPAVKIGGARGDVNLMVGTALDGGTDYLLWADATNSNVGINVAGSDDIEATLQVSGDVGITGELRVNAGKKVGIGIVPDVELHVADGSAGSVTANPNAQLAIESDAHAALNFISPATHNSIIYFGDAANSSIGYINYVHPTDTLNFNTASDIRVAIDSTATQIT